KALNYLRQAARKASARWAFREASRYLELALEAIKSLADRPDSASQEIDIRLELRNVLVPQARHARIAEILERATALAEQLRDPERLGWICLYQTVVHTELDGALEAVEWGRRAVALAEEAGEPILTLSAYSAVIAACHTVGDYRQAIEAANCA